MVLSAPLDLTATGAPSAYMGLLSCLMPSLRLGFLHSIMILEISLSAYIHSMSPQRL